MSNFKFGSLLAATPLSEEDKYNLTVIFDVVGEARQMDIIEHWGSYLEKILQIHGRAESERKQQMQETFIRINQMIDDAYLRDQAKKQQEKLQQQEKDANIIAAMEYDQRRKMADIIKKEEEMQIARERLLDPLAFI